MKLLTILPLLMLTGCSTLLTTANDNVAHTTIQGKIADQPFSIQNPKDTDISGFDVTVVKTGTNITARLHIDTLSARQNTNAIAEAAQIVSAQGEANVNLVNAIGTQTANAVGASAKSAAK